MHLLEPTASTLLPPATVCLRPLAMQPCLNPTTRGVQHSCSYPGHTSACATCHSLPQTHAIAALPGLSQPQRSAHLLLHQHHHERPLLCHVDIHHRPASCNRSSRQQVRRHHPDTVTLSEACKSGLGRASSLSLMSYLTYNMCRACIPTTRQAGPPQGMRMLQSTCETHAVCAVTPCGIRAEGRQAGRAGTSTSHQHLPAPAPGPASTSNARLLSPPSRSMVHPAQAAAADLQHHQLLPAPPPRPPQTLPLKPCQPQVQPAQRCAGGDVRQSACTSALAAV